MKKYECHKCGSNDVFIDKRGVQNALCCGDCGSWIKWISKKELPLVKRFIEGKEGPKESSQKDRFNSMVGLVVRHFKGKEYSVLGIVEHTETGEDMVLYKACYGENKFYVRPFDMFMGKVDKEKYPNIEQEYRFELIKFWDGEK